MVSLLGPARRLGLTFKHMCIHTERWGEGGGSLRGMHISNTHTHTRERACDARTHGETMQAWCNRTLIGVKKRLKDASETHFETMYQSVKSLILRTVLSWRGSTIEKPKYDASANSDGDGSLRNATFSSPTKFKSPEACHEDIDAAREL